MDYAGDLAQLREAFSFAKDMLNTTSYGRAMMSMTLPDLENGPVCLAGKETGRSLILKRIIQPTGRMARSRNDDLRGSTGGVFHKGSTVSDLRRKTGSDG